jgi:serine/threonine-protein kinase
VDPISEFEIQTELHRILASPEFRSSERLRRFLRFAVERTLAGEAAQLKEYLVGREVFDRGSSYDPRTDSIVRVEAQRLRRKLREYYQAHGSADPIRISIQAGSYVPAFARPVRVDADGAENSASPGPPDPRTVAVFPFSNLSPEPNQEYFCDGIAEDIINALTPIPQFKVIARATTLSLKRSTADLREMGSHLGAGTIIEGTVRKAGNVLRISAKLVSSETQQVLWSWAFDRPAQDLFAVGDEIARSIADALRATLGPDFHSKAFPTHLSPGQSLLPVYPSQNIDPHSAICEACQQRPSEWFIYLVAKHGPADIYHSQRCELCTKKLILRLIKDSRASILISHWKRD